MGLAGNDGGAMLSGVKVIDLTTVVFGPYATQILSDLGADVLKVETPGMGDISRHLGATAITPGMSSMFMAINGGKRSTALDLKDTADLATMHALLADADVFVLNVRGAAAARLGLDYASVRAINPGIIYVHCVGFGEDGPYAGEAAYDDVIQAASGATSLLSRVDGNPAARYFPSLIADKVSGLHGAYAALAALIHKLRTGEGQRVEVPMFEAYTRFMLIEHLGGLSFDPPVGPPCYFRQIDPDRQPCPSSDGYVSIVPYTDPAWGVLFAALGEPEIITDPRFATREARMVNTGALYQTLAQITPRFTSAELVTICATADIPARIARDIADIRADPHLISTDFFTRRDHPSEGGFLDMKHPVQFGAWSPGPRTFPPLLDADGPTVRKNFAATDT